jgi:hypothetical protein
LVPSSLITGSATAAQLTALATQYHSAIFLDAWLQGVGALLSVVFFVALVHLSGAGSRFAGWMVMIASTSLLAAALGDVIFTVAATNAAMAGHAATAQVAFDFVAGPTEAFDYGFLFVPAPSVILSLGAVLLGSGILPRVLGYLALGVAFLALGLASILSPLSGMTGVVFEVVFEVVQLCQVLWVVASAIFLCSNWEDLMAGRTIHHCSGVGCLSSNNAVPAILVAGLQYYLRGWPRDDGPTLNP